MNVLESIMIQECNDGVTREQLDEKYRISQEKKECKRALRRNRGCFACFATAIILCAIGLVFIIVFLKREPILPDAIRDYCKAQNCEWTNEYRCPWDHRPNPKNQWAEEERTTKFYACCKGRNQIDQPCGELIEDEEYCKKTGCSWTTETPCPWVENIPKGKRYAQDDNSRGFRLCCIERTSEHKSCGNF